MPGEKNTKLWTAVSGLLALISRAYHSLIVQAPRVEKAESDTNSTCGFDNHKGTLWNGLISMRGSDPSIGAIYCRGGAREGCLSTPQARIITVMYLNVALYLLPFIHRMTEKLLTSIGFQS